MLLFSTPYQGWLTGKAKLEADSKRLYTDAFRALFRGSERAPRAPLFSKPDTSGLAEQVPLVRAAGHRRGLVSRTQITGGYDNNRALVQGRTPQSGKGTQGQSHVCCPHCHNLSQTWGFSVSRYISSSLKRLISNQCTVLVR